MLQAELEDIRDNQNT